MDFINEVKKSHSESHIGEKSQGDDKTTIKILLAILQEISCNCINERFLACYDIKKNRPVLSMPM